MKRILITGGTGYIGSKFIDATKLLHEFRVLTRRAPGSPDSSVRYYVVSDPASISKAFQAGPIDIVVHLASMAQYQWSAQNIPEFISANIEFGSLILQNMAEHGCKRLINFSTYWQEFSLESPKPICYYAATKAAFENIIDFYTLESGIAAVTLRLFDTYGPNDPRPKIFSQLLKAHQQQEPIDLSSGQQTIYFTHISDVVSAIERVISGNDLFRMGQHLKYDVRGYPHKLKDAVKLFCELKDINPRIIWGGKKDRKNQIMNPVCKDQLPDWKPEIDILRGFKDL